MSNESDTFGFDKMSADELRRIVTTLFRDNIDMKEQKKAYTDGINEILKNNQERMEMACSFITALEKSGQDGAHEKRVADFLADQASPH
jgi:predicted transcriptional regulator of viral defense system